MRTFVINALQLEVPQCVSEGGMCWTVCKLHQSLLHLATMSPETLFYVYLFLCFGHLTLRRNLFLISNT